MNTRISVVSIAMVWLAAMLGAACPSRSSSETKLDAGAEDPDGMAGGGDSVVGLDGLQADSGSPDTAAADAALDAPEGTDAAAVDAAPDVPEGTDADAATGSCQGRCSAEYDAAAACQCNVGCGGFDNCCSDYSALCLPALSTCGGRCGSSYDAALPCQCNVGCSSFGNCCADYEDQCLPALSTCEGRCGISYDAALPCQCNDACATFGNCCEDWSQACGAPCVPACAEYQTCQDGSCRGKACTQPDQCPDSDCFEGQCTDGGCIALCGSKYGAGKWTCYAGGWCGRLECSYSGDCSGGADCVVSPAPSERDPDGTGVVDYQCEGASGSPCKATCAPAQRCSAATGKCQ